MPNQNNTTSTTSLSEFLTEQLTINGHTYTITEVSMKKAQQFNDLFIHLITLEAFQLPPNATQEDQDSLTAKQNDIRLRFMRYVLNCPTLDLDTVENMSDRQVEGAMDKFTTLNQASIKKLGEKFRRFMEAMGIPADSPTTINNSNKINPNEGAASESMKPSSPSPTTSAPPVDPQALFDSIARANSQAGMS